MRVHCEASGPVPPSGWTVLRITSINDEPGTVTWPVRLHPAEGTVSFLVDGVRHRSVEQVDSIVDTVDLEPGQAISTGVLVASGDLGPILPDVGEVGLRVAVRPPGPGNEVLSNEVRIDVVDDREAAGRSRWLHDLDAAATAARDDDASDADVSIALDEVAADERAWAATALLPPAPVPDDVLLSAARDLDERDRVGAPDDGPSLAAIVLDGHAYRDGEVY